MKYSRLKCDVILFHNFPKDISPCFTHFVIPQTKHKINVFRNDILAVCLYVAKYAGSHISDAEMGGVFCENKWCQINIVKFLEGIIN